MLFVNNLFNKLQSKRILLKLAITFTGSCVTSVIIVALFFSNWMYSESVSNINDMSRLALSNICVTISNTFNASSKSAYSIYKIPSITKLMLSDKPEMSDLYTANLYLGQTLASSPYLSSIYICNGHSIVLDKGSSYNFSDTSDNVSNLINKKRVLYPIYRVLKNDKGETLELYSFVYNEPSGNNTFMPTVIVNIKVQDLYKQVFSKFMNLKEDLIITDNVGNVLMNKNMTMLSDNIADKDYYKKTANSKTDWGYFSSDFEGKSNMFNYLRFDNGKYVAYLVSDYNSFFSKIRSMQKSIILLCLPVVIAIIALSYYFSYIFFSPINNIFYNVKNFFGSIPDKQKSSFEIKYLSNSISNIIEKLNSLEQDKKSNFKTAKNSFLNDFLTSGNQMSQYDLSEDFLKFKIISKLYPKYAIVVLRIGNHNEFTSSNTTSAIDFQLDTIENISQEIISSKFECSPNRIASNHVILILGILDSSLENSAIFFTEILSMIKTVQNTVFQVLNIEITVGISEYFTCLDSFIIKEKYTQAYKLTNYRLIYGALSVFRTTDIVTTEVKNDKIINSIDLVTNSVKRENLEEYKNHLHTLFNEVKCCKFDNIVKYFSQLATYILEIPSKLHPLTAYTINMSPEEIYNSIKSFENYDELQEWFIQLFMKSTEILTNIKSYKNKDLIGNVINYIKDNYNENNISANQMAERLSITPQYFSKLFKENTGYNFPDYMNNVRLEKAKDILLSEQELSISQVAEKVGFFNKPYFTASFTKKFGVSPTKFKQLNKI